MGTGWPVFITACGMLGAALIAAAASVVTQLVMARAQNRRDDKAHARERSKLACQVREDLFCRGHAALCGVLTDPGQADRYEREMIEVFARMQVLGELDTARQYFDALHKLRRSLEETRRDPQYVCDGALTQAGRQHAVELWGGAHADALQAMLDRMRELHDEADE